MSVPDQLSTSSNPSQINTYFILEDGTILDQFPGITNLPVNAGFRIIVPNDSVPEAGKQTKPEYEVLRWHYSLGKSSKTPGLVVIVHPVKQYWFSKLNQDQQVMLGYSLIALTLIPSAAVVLLYFINRTELLALLGWYCRYVVGWCLFALGALLPLRIKGWGTAKPTLLGTYLGLLLPVLGILAAGAWIRFSTPTTALSSWPDDYAAYARQLSQRIEIVWPVALSILPWVALLAKVAKWELLGKVVESIAGWKKK